MVNYELHEDKGILVVTPSGKLQADDFNQLAHVADPFIEQHGNLNGLLIFTEQFPGWDSFAAFTSHLKFISNHHHLIKKVAAVTNSGVIKSLQGIANVFIAAEFQQFPFQDKHIAMNWLEESQAK